MVNGECYIVHSFDAKKSSHRFWEFNRKIRKLAFLGQIWALFALLKWLNQNGTCTDGIGCDVNSFDARRKTDLSPRCWEYCTQNGEYWTIFIHNSNKCDSIKNLWKCFGDIQLEKYSTKLKKNNDMFLEMQW